MRIFNVMMSKDLGGIQQAFIDYHDALAMQKHEVINITSIFAEVNNKIHLLYTGLNFGGGFTKAAHVKLQNQYDIKIVSKKLSNILKQIKNEL